MVIPSDICFDSGVVDVKVGNTSQFVQSAEVPGALLKQVAQFGERAPRGVAEPDGTQESRQALRA